MIPGALSNGPLALAIPEIWLAGSACLILLCDVYFGATRRSLTATLTMLALTIGVALTGQYGLTEQRFLLFNGLYVADSLAGFLKMAAFVAMAVAEKVSALETATFFEDRKARADFKAFDRIMRRRGGQPPREGDEMPE